MPTLKTKASKPAKLVYWKPVFIYRTPTGDIYTQQQHDKYKKLKDMHVVDWKQICGSCSTPYEGKKPACICVMHVCGSWSTIGLQAGRCQSEIHCFRCCRCIICAKCGINLTNIKGFDGAIGIKEKYHRECYRCMKCCECPDCINCGEKVSRSCSDCSSTHRIHHADCCDSDKRIAANGSKLLMTKRIPTFYEGTDFQDNRIRRFLSVESEIVGYSRDHLAKMNAFNLSVRKWHHSVVPDGTVPHGGEICTAPASGNKFLEIINELQAQHLMIESQVNIRCGMHVHVDARDFSYIDLINFIYLYYLVEPALFAMLPPWRRINRFATPCRSTLLSIAKNGDKLVDSIKDEEMYRINKYTSGGAIREPERRKKPSIALKMAEKLYGTPTLMHPKRHHKTHDNQHIRYMSINLHSWVYRRTVEFRHWPGSLNLQEMQLWPQLCGALMEYAKRTPLKDIRQLPKEPVEALLQVLEQKSWISKGLQQFADGMIKIWSPDWKNVWNLLQDNEDESVIPFNKSDKIGMLLGFDLNTKFYTYLPSSRCTWEYQWGNPAIVGGRYATPTDLIAVPRGKIEWLREAPFKPIIPATPKIDDALNYGQLEAAYRIAHAPPIQARPGGIAEAMPPNYRYIVDFAARNWPVAPLGAEALNQPLAVAPDEDIADDDVAF